MVDAVRFPFAQADSAVGPASNLPQLPISLTHVGRVVSVSGLLDTGAAVNVLPYRVGIELGAVWEQQTTPLRLTGNLAQLDARVLIVAANVAQFAPVRLAFAWTQADDTPVILGQVNFFLEFDVCFYRSRLLFEIRSKTPGS